MEKITLIQGVEYYITESEEEMMVLKKDGASIFTKADKDTSQGRDGYGMHINNISIYEKEKIFCKFEDSLADKLHEKHGGKRGTTIITEYSNEYDTSVNIYEVQFFHKGAVYVKYFEARAFPPKRSLWRD